MYLYFYSFCITPPRAGFFIAWTTNESVLPKWLAPIDAIKAPPPLMSSRQLGRAAWFLLVSGTWPVSRPVHAPQPNDHELLHHLQNVPRAVPGDVPLAKCHNNKRDSNIASMAVSRGKSLQQRCICGINNF